MLDKILALRNVAEKELSTRTKGAKTSFPVFAFLLYPATSLRFASVIDRRPIRKMINSVTGDDILFIVVEPLEYRTHFVYHPIMKKYHRAQIIRKSANFIRKILDFMGSIPGLREAFDSINALTN